MFRVMPSVRARSLRLTARVRHRDRSLDSEAQRGTWPRLISRHGPHPPVRAADRSLERSAETLDGLHPSGKWPLAVDHNVLGPNDDRDFVVDRINPGWH